VSASQHSPAAWHDTHWPFWHTWQVPQGGLQPAGTHVPPWQTWPVGQPQAPFVQQPPGHADALTHVPSAAQQRPAAAQEVQTPLRQTLQAPQAVTAVKHWPPRQHLSGAQPQTPFSQQPFGQAEGATHCPFRQQRPAGQQVLPQTVPVQSFVVGSQHLPAGHVPTTPFTQQLAPLSDDLLTQVFPA
jgi:hypothetical protein